MLCGQRTCPLLERMRIQNPIKARLSEDMSGQSPSIFVGWKGYPNVYAGPMTSMDSSKTTLLDDPSRWYGKGFDDIIEMRSLLVRSKQSRNVREKTRYVSELQEIALSKKPVDVETHFKKKPTYSISFSAINQPMGPSGVLEKLKVTENPKIPKKVDYVVSDELKAGDALGVLYGKEYDVYYLTNILSSGSLGVGDMRRMVPTRWSITAVDDILGKHLITKIRQYPPVNHFLSYSNTYLENHFEVLLIPGSWEFEQFEAWAPKTWWTQSHDKPVIVEEYEGYKGKRGYALNEGGGYYAGRFGVVEALERMRRQARVVVFREVYDTYVMPVGVWEVRENVRKAMQSKPEKFNTLPAALDNINTRLTIPIQEYAKKSEILKQRRLSDYL